MSDMYGNNVDGEIWVPVPDKRTIQYLTSAPCVHCGQCHTVTSVSGPTR